MGQAKARGTKEQRVKEAIERNEAIALERVRQRAMDDSGKKLNLNSSAMIAFGMAMIADAFLYEPRPRTRRSYGPSKSKRYKRR